MRRFLFPVSALAMMVAGGTLLALTNCGGGGGNGNSDAGDAGEAGATDTGSDSVTTPPDAIGDTGPAPVSCTAPPSFQTAIAISHSPDHLRSVANGALGLLDDGTLLILELEQLDTSARHGLFFRTLDTTSATPTPSDPDVRIDGDGDGLTAGSALSLTKVAPNLYALAWQATGGAGRLRLWRQGKWSPEMSTTMPFVYGEQLSYAVSASGDVLVSHAGSGTPATQASLYSASSGTWGPAQKLDLDGSTGAAVTYLYALPDGRYYAATWQGAGGPVVHVRTPSGAWQAPSPRADTGALSTSPDLRVLADGSILLTALENLDTPTPDTRRAMYATWTASGGWTGARVLSKNKDGSNAVVPLPGGRVDPRIFAVDDSTFDFISWWAPQASCSSDSSTCAFNATARRFSGGSWQDPTDLGLASDGNGAGGLFVFRANGQPVVVRRSADLTSVKVISRTSGTAAWTTPNSPFDPTSFPAGTQIKDVNVFGSLGSIYAYASNTTAPDAGAPTTNPSAIGKWTIGSAVSGPWSSVTDPASSSWHGIGAVLSYIDGTGSLTMATQDMYASSGSTSLGLVHVDATTGKAEVLRALLDSGGEVSARVVGPSEPPRSTAADKGSLVMVQGSIPSSGNPLRAYAWNGNGAAVPKPLAAVVRNPRVFAAGGVLSFGCGGAAFYGVDPTTDGSHYAEIVLVK